MKRIKKLIEILSHFYEKHKKIVLIVIVVILILLGIIINYFSKTNTATKTITKEDDAMVTVNMVGAINKPNYVTKYKEAYLFDLIIECGGLSDYADLSEINLVSKITVDMTYNIPFQEEAHDNEIHFIDESYSSNIIYVYFGYIDSKLNVYMFDSGITIKEILWRLEMNENDFNMDLNEVLYSDYSFVKGADKVSLNYANASELLKIAGIGEAIANRIIEYREKNGFFSSVDELLNITGITKTLLNKIKDKIKLN